MTAAHAVEEINLKHSDLYRFDTRYQISGAYTLDGHFFSVQDDNDPTIYELIRDHEKIKLKPFIKFEELEGYYHYISTLPKRLKNRPFDLEGLTSCSGAFFVVNESAGDVIRATFERMKRVEIDATGFPNFDYNHVDGFEGIAVNCEEQLMFVAKTKNPNLIFEIDIEKSRVIKKYDLSEGKKSDLNNISDLFFEDGQLYVLQKNRSSILVMNPGDPAKLYHKRYSYKDYQGMFDRADGQPLSRGLEEGMFVDGDSVLLFMDQKSDVGQLSTKGKELGLDPSDSGLILELSL